MAENGPKPAKIGFWALKTCSDGFWELQSGENPRESSKIGETGKIAIFVPGRAGRCGNPRKNGQKLRKRTGHGLVEIETVVGVGTLIHDRLLLLVMLVKMDI